MDPYRLGSPTLCIPPTTGSSQSSEVRIGHVSPALLPTSGVVILNPTTNPANYTLPRGRSRNVVTIQRSDSSEDTVQLCITIYGLGTFSLTTSLTFVWDDVSAPANPVWLQLSNDPLLAYKQVAFFTTIDPLSIVMPWSISISDDGTILAVGDPGYNNDVGIVRIYRKINNIWVESETLAITTTFQIQFGISISLSGDGVTLAVGAPHDEFFGEGAYVGYVYIFVNSAGVFVPSSPPKVSGTPLSSQSQGTYVSLSYDGSTLIEKGQGFDFWIFERTGLVYNQVQQITTPVFSDFICISGDGSTIALAQDAGVFIYTLNGLWSLTAELVGFKGYSVSLSYNGSVLASGSPNEGIVFTGATYIFVKTAGTWDNGIRLIGSNNNALVDSQQGTSVSISADGLTFATGGDDTNMGVGATWIFRKIGTQWVEQQKIVGDFQGDYYPEQGFSVALSGDSNTVGIGSIKFFNVGAVWIFNRCSS